MTMICQTCLPVFKWIFFLFSQFIYQFCK